MFHPTRTLLRTLPCTMRGPAQGEKAVLALFVLALVALLPTSAFAQQATLTDDATYPAGVGTYQVLTVQGPSAEKGQPATAAYVRFKLTGSTSTQMGDLPSGTAGTEVKKATLRMFVSAVNASGKFNVYRVTGSWSENGATAPAYDTSNPVATNVTVPAANSYIALDVTSLVKEWLDCESQAAGGCGNHGLAFVSDSGTPTMSFTFDSKESKLTSHPAQLSVLLNQAGDAENFTGQLEGDVTGTQSATVVSKVGGKSASDVAAAADDVNASTPNAVGGTLVRRDASGNFSAGSVTANLTGNVTGDLTGRASTAGTADTANALSPSATIGGAQVSGALTNATIDGSKVTGTVANATTASTISVPLNLSYTETVITSTSTNGDGVSGISTSKQGVSGKSTNGFGVYGVSTNNTGIYGRSDAPANVYMPGILGASKNSSGVHGIGEGPVGQFSPGVHGRSDNSVGVQGEGNGPAGSFSPGVLGRSINSSGVRGDSTNGNAVDGYSANYVGVRGEGHGPSGTFSVGVSGVSTNNAGVVGEGKGPIGTFSPGVAGASDNSIGVRGNGNGPANSYSPGVEGKSINWSGVVGISEKSGGVYGQGDGPAGSFSPGVHGLSANSVGVSGTSNAPAATWAPGVQGISANSAGVFGLGNGPAGQFSPGLFGKSENTAGVWGEGTGPNSPGVYAKNTAGGLAGQFDGNVTINGNLNVTGTTSTTVNHAATADTANALSASATVSAGQVSGALTGATIAGDKITGNLNITGNGTVSGTLSAGTVSATTQFNIGGERILSAAGSNNIFVGAVAGRFNSTGYLNAFVGSGAGSNNTEGQLNAFFGALAGRFNTVGFENSMFGYSAGVNNTGGIRNSFIGVASGSNNIGGSYNTFLGAGTGGSNTSERFNTYIGAIADGAPGITNATALGANAKVTQSNSLVLGSINGQNGATADTRVGIGTSAPQAKLHVQGGQLYVGTPGQGIILKSPDSTKCATLTIDNAGALVVSAVTCP